MNALRFLFNPAPKSKIYLLYAGSWLLLLLLGYGFIAQQVVSQRIKRVNSFAELVMNVTAPVLAEAALGNKTLLVQQALDATASSPYFDTLTITSLKGEVMWQSQIARHPLSAPHGLNNWLQSQLPVVQKPLVHAGQNVGLLQISFETEVMANEIWTMYWLSLIFLVTLATVGVLLGLVPLARALREVTLVGRQADLTLDTISEGVISCNEHLHVIAINKAAQRLLGLSVSDESSGLGQDIRRLLPGLFGDHEVNANWVAREYRFIRHDGEQIMLEAGLVEVQRTDPQPVCKVLTLRDVTAAHALASAQRAQLQEHIAAIASMKSVVNSVAQPMHVSQAYQALADDNELNTLTARVLGLVAEHEKSRLELENQRFAIDQHALVVIFDIQGTITYVNDRYCRVSGFNRGELLGLRPHLNSLARNTNLSYEAMFATVSKGQTWHGELHDKSKVGELVWVDATAVPLYSEFLFQERIMLIGTDITAAKKNKQLLAANLQLMEVLLEATPVAVYFKDSLGRYSLMNPAFETLFGFSHEDLVGKTAFDVVPSAFARFTDEKDLQLKAAGGIQFFETVYEHPQTGAKSDFSYSKALTTDEQGHITGIVGVIVDVTERKRIEGALQAATREAQAANRAKSDFLANMSHEIRTPMNGVIGMVELALEMAVDSSQRDYLSLAKKSSQSLMVVINDILDISKIEANRVDLESTEFSLGDFIAHSLKPVQALAKQKGLIFTLETSPALTDHVMGDPNRLRQILINLCDNAIKFTPKGRVIVRVTGTPVVDEAFELSVAVVDTGIGIAAEAQSSIFEIFSQADTSTTRKYGGSGLGLSISLKLASLMGGHITLASETGQGSTFTLRLRMSVPKPVKQVMAMPAVATFVPPAPLVPKLNSAFNVMLVEDNLVNQILCCTILKKIGHTVVVANHGQEAVDLFAKQPWDVILMDMQMPVMDGLDATRAIRALELPGQRTPIVAMTANAMESDRQLCLDAGMDDYLSKPFKFGDLQAILEKTILRNKPSEA